ncbi:Rv1355c family protein [Pedobacter frigoris]|uniref:Rv1355c family protein n=1 Tax=Pedobacter frigoris TaxID=2571272 RepID=A0A4U1CQB9_9SPHI|nr:Rv1355c family protein [Pedobacter frigoris]TKC09015.1 Rv1355c family protein [Pedobacter frigoris]
MYLNKDINKFIKEFTLKNELYRNSYTPVFYRISNVEEEVKFISLLKEKPYIQVFDTIQNQLTDLVKGLSPSTIFNENLIKETIVNHLDGADITKYGVWAYYPWMEKVVHILDEEEYVLVRTNRNKHKITQEEQDHLSKKKIGVMGLSVGQSVSLTIAIERGCGELRIADFDVLDLTNLNRIRSGIQNIDLKKTVIVAREIAEIDPYLKVTCFHEGITEENIDTFLTAGGKLDLLIDECDSFDIKISSREKAKSLGIPVLMEGSDRCTIDIERFDLEPDRPVLHGFVKDMDMQVFKSLKTMDEKIPYIAPVTGVETLSPRMKASAIEIMSSISTWPQLASAVTYGGGISADISRKILLGQLKVSGRFWIDMDELIFDAENESGDKEIEVQKTPDFATYIKTHLSDDSTGEELTEDLLNLLITAANKAPSGGNNQPWLWHYGNKTLHLFLNKPVSGAYLDPDYISSYISLGAAIENLLLAASVNELKVEWKLTPELLPDHVALFKFSKGNVATLFENQLAAQIESRHTNRKSGIKHDLDVNELKLLETIASENTDVSLSWITDNDALKTLGEIAGDADLLRMFIPDAHSDFIEKEMRWTIEETNDTADGISIHSLDLTNNDQIGLRLMKDKKAISFLKSINGGSAFKKLALKQFLNSSAIGLITIPQVSPLSYLKGGIAVEKLWLKAADLGYQIHPMNVPLIFFYKNNFEQSSDLSDEIKAKISQMHGTFRGIFKISNDIAEVFLFRLFKAESSPVKTIRRPLNKTLSFGTAETTY